MDINADLRIEDIKEPGAELDEDQLLVVSGGCGSSGTWTVEWGSDTDKAF